MFGRMLWQLLRFSRARLAVAFATLITGAAVLSALISLQLDVTAKLTRAFRTLGANVVVAPRRAPGQTENDAALMPESVWERVQGLRDPAVVAAAPYLYVVARAPTSGGSQQVIVAGTSLENVRAMDSWWRVSGAWANTSGFAQAPRAMVGTNVARQFKLKPGDSLELWYPSQQALSTRPAEQTPPGSHSPSLHVEVVGIITAGGAEDNQILVALSLAQQLAGLPHRIGMVQLSVAGTAQQIQGFVSRLAAALPEQDVQPIRQFTAAEEQLLGRIRLLILATVALILILTVLGVLATMAALAMERGRDVGLMKAIGGPMRRVLRLFLVEVGILGGLGGLCGYGLGIGLAEWLGRRVFGTGISVRLEVLPLTVLLMLGAALAGALPLRLLSRVSPAVILRGE